MNKGSKLKNAILYATSLYEGAEQCHKLNETYNDVKALRNILAEGVKDFDLLNNPIWPLDVKEKLIDTVAEKMGFSQPLVNLLKILVENRRFDELEQILQIGRAHV